MKKAIIGFAAIGAAIGLRLVTKDAAHKMPEHCKEMMGAGEATSPEAMHNKMREHCQQMAAHHEAPSEPIAAG